MEGGDPSPAGEKGLSGDSGQKKNKPISTLEGEKKREKKRSSRGLRESTGQGNSSEEETPGEIKNGVGVHEREITGKRKGGRTRARGPQSLSHGGLNREVDKEGEKKKGGG